jgi:hypothetical protein
LRYHDETVSVKMCPERAALALIAGATRQIVARYGF